MKMLRETAVCAVLFASSLVAASPVYSQPNDGRSSADNSRLEDLSEILRRIPQLATEYRIGSDYQVEEFQRGFLGPVYLITIGHAEDCLRKKKLYLCVDSRQRCHSICDAV